MVAGLLAIGWLNSLGSEEPAPRLTAVHADLPDAEPKQLTVESVTSARLIRLDMELALGFQSYG